MSGSPARVRPPRELQQVISVKLTEIIGHSDNVLPEYIMVMISNFRNRDQVAQELEAFLGSKADLFTRWLWQILKSDLYPTLVVPPIPAELLKPAASDVKGIVESINRVPPARAPGVGGYTFHLEVVVRRMSDVSCAQVRLCRIR
jgi:hypothetical protein